MDPDPTKGVAPSSKRIVQDIEGVWKAMKIIYDKKGVYVPGLANRTGRRFFRNTTHSKIHGGPRQKGDHSIANLEKSTPLHGDLKGMREEERAMREAGKIMTVGAFLEGAHLDDGDCVDDEPI